MLYKKIVLKLSGEALRGSQNDRIGSKCLAHYVAEIKKIYGRCALAVVIGGGNFLRGQSVGRLGLEKESGDYMGMLATLINGIALGKKLQRVGIPSQMVSRLPVDSVIALPFKKETIHAMWAQGKVVVLGGGTGKPGCSTDSAAALVAALLEADAWIKGTKVDGIYSADPQKESDALFIKKMAIQEVLDRNLSIMDRGALEISLQNGLPIHIYNATKEGALASLLLGDPVGSRLFIE